MATIPSFPRLRGLFWAQVVALAGLTLVGDHLIAAREARIATSAAAFAAASSADRAAFRLVRSAQAPGVLSDLMRADPQLAGVRLEGLARGPQVGAFDLGQPTASRAIDSGWAAGSRLVVAVHAPATSSATGRPWLWLTALASIILLMRTVRGWRAALVDVATLSTSTTSAHMVAVIHRSDEFGWLARQIAVRAPDVPAAANVEDYETQQAG